MGDGSDMNPLPWRLHALVLLILAATLAASRWSTPRLVETLSAPLGSIEPDIGSWTNGIDRPFPDSVLETLKTTSYLSRIYHKGDRQLGFLVSYYGHQHTGESIHSPKNCLPGSGWEIW